MSSFLDNSGDILLDAVLTDYGRQLLAKGDGSFNIVKFAFGDDEIDYSLYVTGSGTSQKDTKIMQTPILEAMTNNIASLKSKLLTIANKNLLFLPVMKQNKTNDSTAKQTTFSFLSGFKCHAVPVDTNGTKSFDFLTSSNTNTSTKQEGILTGNNYIRVDQGFDSSETDKRIQLSSQFPDLVETQYNVVIDSRFGIIEDVDGGVIEPTIDDDGMATYSFSSASGNNKYVSQMSAVPSTGTDSEKTDILGTRGTKLVFSVRAAGNLSTTNAFSKYGFSVGTSPNTASCIKTFVKVIGVNTGYSVDIPVIFVYKAS